MKLIAVTNNQIGSFVFHNIRYMVVSLRHVELVRATLKHCMISAYWADSIGAIPLAHTKWSWNCYLLIIVFRTRMRASVVHFSPIVLFSFLTIPILLPFIPLFPHLNPFSLLCCSSVRQRIRSTSSVANCNNSSALSGSTVSLTLVLKKEWCY